MPAVDGWRGARAWVFDLDGTLTVPVHDFDGIRAALDLPVGEPILEAIAALPPDLAEARRAALHRIEQDLAAQATARPGSVVFVRAVRASGAPLAVLTRNDHGLARITLRRIALDDCFEHVIGRTEAPPKPSPEGILRLARGWGVSPADVVMVGDGKYDVEAGRNAGARTVVVGDAPWAAEADLRVDQLDELLPLLGLPT